MMGVIGGPPCEEDQRFLLIDCCLAEKRLKTRVSHRRIFSLMVRNDGTSA